MSVRCLRPGAGLSALALPGLFALLLLAIFAPIALAAAPVDDLEREPAPAAASIHEEAFDFVGDWEYRWGDSPRDGYGAPLWADPPRAGAAAEAGWQHLGKQTIPTPPGHHGQRFLWLRTRLDGPSVDDPVFYIGPVNQLLEGYVDGRLAYRFGQIDGEGKDARRFAGYPMHFIPLGNNYQGRTLTLRIYSQHITIGFIGGQRIGSKVRIITDTLRNDLPKIVVGIVLCAIGLFVSGLYLMARSERSYLYYAIFAFTMGLFLLSQCRVRNFFFNMPLAWMYVNFFSLYVAAGCLMLFLSRVLGRGPLGLMPILARILITYPAVAALLIAGSPVSLMQTLVIFEYGALVTIAYLLISVAVLLRQGNRDVRLFGAGLVAAVLLSGYDVLASIGVAPRPLMSFASFGQGLFVMTLGLLMALRFRRLHQDLVDTKQALSEKLGALEVRNSEIEGLNAELRHQIEARSKQLVQSLIDTGTASSTENVPLFGKGALINDRYRVIRLIGQGAMGVVYEVERVHDSRRFAAKVLSSRARRKELARFAREAQLLARLKHENLVSIADVDVTSSRLAYIIMELVDGTTLEEQSDRFADLTFALPVLRQLAEALAKVHAEGVVHRDLCTR